MFTSIKAASRLFKFHVLFKAFFEEIVETLVTRLGRRFEIERRNVAFS